MYKYNPTECQPCPKCGVDIDVKILEKKYVDLFSVGRDISYIEIICKCCGYVFKRRPLDYEGDD